MKAAYPVTPKSGKRTTPASLHWCEMTKRGFFLDGQIVSASDCVRLIRGMEARSIVFFPDLRAHVGKLIPYLLEHGVLIGAGDVLRSLHFVEKKKIIYLSDASLYFFDPNAEKMELLNQSLFEAMRVRLAPTPGNTAMRIMRRFIGIKALWQPPDDTRTVSHAALYGGALHWLTGKYERGYKYDIHSAYAWAMREAAFPLRPRLHFGMPNESSDGMIFVVQASFHTSRKFSPLVLYGQDDEAYHPTQAENITLALNYLDIQTLIASGSFEIHEIKNTITWLEGPKILAEPMGRIDELQEAIQEIKPAMKIIRNACFGKFAEHDEMSALTLEPLTIERKKDREIVDIIESRDMLYALVREEKYKPAPQHNPIFAGLVTSMIRKRIYETIDKDTIYVDTDGFISTRKRTDIQEGPGFGDWYLDEEGRAVILGPRIYGLAGKTKIAGQHEYVSIKELTEALEREVKVFESITPNPLTLEGNRTSERTLKAIKYPHVEARQGNLFITRSPTIKIKSKLPDWI